MKIWSRLRRLNQSSKTSTNIRDQVIINQKSLITFVSKNIYFLTITFKDYRRVQNFFLTGNFKFHHLVTITCKTFEMFINSLYLWRTSDKSQRKTYLLPQKPVMFHVAFPSFIKKENIEISGVVCLHLHKKHWMNKIGESQLYLDI